MRPEAPVLTSAFADREVDKIGFDASKPVIGGMRAIDYFLPARRPRPCREKSKHSVKYVSAARHMLVLGGDAALHAST